MSDEKERPTRQFGKARIQDRDKGDEMRDWLQAGWGQYVLMGIFAVFVITFLISAVRG